ncbi:DUF2059 domain-containing protein [Brevundimonas sp.]
MKFVSATLIIAATLATPQYATAAIEPSAVAAMQVQSGDVASRLVLVRRYFNAIQFDQLMNGMLNSQLDATIAQGRIPADRQSVFREAATAAYAVVIPRMIEESMQMYAEAFTTDELEQLVAFYESPVGQSMMTKTVMLTQKTGEIMQRYGPQMEAEMFRQLCSRIDCEAEGLAR